MKLKLIIGLSSALCLSAMIVQAQETNEVEQLKRQLRQMQESFEKTKNEQQQQIEALTQKLDSLAKAKPPAELSATNSPPLPEKAWSPAEPLTVARAGSAYMN